MFLNNDLGRNILADVLIAAAGAAAAALMQHRPTRAQVAHTGEAALDTGQRAVSGTADAVQTAAGTLGSVFTEAVAPSFPRTERAREAKTGREEEAQELEGLGRRSKSKRSKKQDQAQVTH